VSEEVADTMATKNVTITTSTVNAILMLPPIFPQLLSRRARWFTAKRVKYEVRNEERAALLYARKGVRLTDAALSPGARCLLLLTITRSLLGQQFTLIVVL
jgi:hypothetical protein